MFYNVDTFYNVGFGQPTDAKSNSVGPPVLLKNSLAGAWYVVNMTWSEDLGPNKDFTIGITARNITDQGNGPTPCQVPFIGIPAQVVEVSMVRSRESTHHSRRVHLPASS